MPAPHADPTVTFVAPKASPASLPGRPSAGRIFDEELRPLLRSRLILVHLLALAFTLLLAVLSRFIRTGEQEALVQFGEGYWWGLLAARLTEGLIGTLVLWRLSGMSLWSLRLWELIFFGTHAATGGLNRFEALAAPLEGAARDVPALALGSAA